MKDIKHHLYVASVCFIFGFPVAKGADSGTSGGVISTTPGGTGGSLKSGSTFNDVTFTGTNTFRTTLSQEAIHLGPELIIGGVLKETTGWSGGPSSWTHSSGADDHHPLRGQLDTGTNLYLVKFTVVAGNASDHGKLAFTVSLGNSPTFDLCMGAEGTYTYSAGIRSIRSGSFELIPNSLSKTAVVKEISVRQILDKLAPSIRFLASEANPASEIRLSLPALANQFLGFQVGQYNATGFGNTAIGYNSFSTNVSGFWNSALGRETLVSNTAGSRCVAIGYNALNANTVGQRNTAIGTFSQVRNTLGDQNISVGSDTLFYNTTGRSNAAIGAFALYSNESGDSTVGIGERSLFYVKDGKNNTALGVSAAGETTGSNIVAVGAFALTHNKDGQKNTAVGYNALRMNTTGSGNVAVGESTLSSVTTGNQNTSVGAGTSSGSSTSSGNTYIGYGTGNHAGVDSGSHNLMLGSYAGYFDSSPDQTFYLDTLERKGSAQIGGTGPSYLFNSDPTLQTLTFNAKTGIGALASTKHQLTVGGDIAVSGSKATVNGSKAGTATFTMPFQGTTFKRVVIYCNALDGTATYTFPTPFTYPPQVISQSLSGIVSPTSPNTVTVTGAPSTGFIELSGF